MIHSSEKRITRNSLYFQPIDSDHFSGGKDLSNTLPFSLRGIYKHFSIYYDLEEILHDKILCHRPETTGVTFSVIELLQFQ